VIDLGIVRKTVTASAVLAAISLIAGLLFSRTPIGIGLAAGLVIGSFNGALVRAVIERRVPFVVATVLRLAAISAVALIAAYLVGASTIALLLGVAAAQLVMVATAVRQGLRAR